MTESMRLIYWIGVLIIKSIQDRNNNRKITWPEEKDFFIFPYPISFLYDILQVRSDEKWMNKHS